MLIIAKLTRVTIYLQNNFKKGVKLYFSVFIFNID